ncbi:MAG TPA: VanZ family protein [Cyclobacteriaceae bacterium]|nr:VanZ family protein [Cyclobacteriaceae bacterium]
MKIKINSFWPAIVWLMVSTIAFFLPGKALPENDWFGKLQVDKWIHIGLFTIMIVLWCLPLLHRHVQKVPRLFMQIAIIFLGYGVVIELIQHFFIPNRSFDWGDIAADTVGCLIGFFYVRNQWKR